MNRNAIGAVVNSLGDFPLEPDSGSAWLWSASGERLLWASEQARAALKQDDAEAAAPLLSPERFIGLSADLAAAAPHLQPIRVQQIVLRNGSLSKSFTCLCRPVLLQGGGHGILAVAIGAPARSLRAMEETLLPTPELSKQDLSRHDLSTPAHSLPAPPLISPPTPALATEHNKVIDTHLDVRNAEAALPAPAWLSLEQNARRPLRFVWQTDAIGSFVHLSRELAEAVGPANAMLIGLTWTQAMERFSVLEGEDIALGFRSRDTWTARAALWPVQDANWGVPVEMAGMPVAQNGAYSGFRGYGIARIERAVLRPGTAAKALAKDDLPESEPAYERFGPVVKRMLEQEDATLPNTPESQDLASQEKTTPAAHINPLPLREGIAHLSAGSTKAASIAIPEPIPEAKPALSNAEREAFREIARALAHSGTESAAVQAPAEWTKPAEADAAGKAPQGHISPQDHSHEPVKAGSLQALKKALSKRARLSFEAPETPERADTKSPSPVISYDTLQARREQRGRIDAMQAPWASIIEKLPIGLLVQQNGAIVFANRYLLDLTGYSDFEAFQTSLKAEQLFVSHGTIQSGDINRFGIVTRTGETLQVDAAIQATTWNDVPASLTTIRRAIDVSSGAQYKALELDLLSARAEVHELRSVLDTATDGIIALDGEGRILSLNRSAEALFGFDQNEITGENLTVLLEPESHVAALDYLEGLKSNGVKSIMNDGRDVKGRERNGGVLPLFMTIGRVGEGQRASRFCVVLRDITHWKKVEADLTDAKRAAEDSSAHKTDFLATVSHEIRTPLNAIIGFSQVMMTESFGPIGNERYRQYVKDINASGEHVVSLVNDLLDLSKVASGKLDLTFGSVDVNTIVAGCVAMIQPQANAGKVIVRSQLGAHLPMVVADERSIRQIVLNLLSNAAKFTEAGGQVIASTSFTDAGEIVIRVRDTGIGMADEDVRRAMEPFRQIPGPRSSGGTGLGLPLTKALVEANRAGFSLQSEPKKGTLVEVTFPSTRVLAE